MRIGEYCNRDVVYIDRGASVSDAARLMRQHHVGSLVVSDSKAEKVIPIAMLTDRDIVVQLIADGVDVDSVVVNDVMSQSLISAKEDDNVVDVIDRMRVQGIRRVPVVSVAGTLVGVFSVDDFIALMAEHMTLVAQLFNREQQKEMKGRPNHMRSVM